MNLGITNQALKTVIENSIIPDLLTELKFYKMVYANSKKIVEEYGEDIEICLCQKCFKYSNFCNDCCETVCEYCDNVEINFCNKCEDLICTKHDFIDGLCEICYKYNKK
jgi:hypothetical protein